MWAGSVFVGRFKTKLGYFTHLSLEAQSRSYQTYISLISSGICDLCGGRKGLADRLHMMILEAKAALYW